MKKIQNIRTNYSLNTLRSQDLKRSPIEQFKCWFSELDHVNDFNTVTLATYSKTHGIQNRVVLLKDIHRDGFVFYTNYQSMKAKQISVNNNVALCFFWPMLQRQVRVNGIALQLSQKLSTRYFKQRPRKSKIAAWASNQSDIVNSRKVLEDKFLELENKFKDKNITKPAHWGGYKISPLSMEFWQGRPDRMHDRFLYVRNRDDDKWSINRLCP